VPLPEPAPGLVICYSYLWHDRRQEGEREGRKDRPCAIINATRDEDEDTLVYVVPITHVRPDDPSAVELPLQIKRRLGLDDAPSWILTTELNRFVWPGYDLRPIARDKPDTIAWGFLPVETFAAVKQGIARHWRAKHLKVVGRD
jgi:hypothetical protein